MIGEITEFLRKYIRWLVATFATVLAVLGHLIFSMNIGIDTEVVINEPGATVSWETIGRQGLLATKFLLSLRNYNPYFSGLMFVLFFSLSGCCFAFILWHFSGKRECYPFGALMLLWCVSPIWMTQFYFSLQRVEVAISFFYVAISVGTMLAFVLDEKKKWYLLVLSYIFGIWCICSYQGNVALYISLVIACFFLHMLQEREEQDAIWYWKKIGQSIAFFLVIFLSNSLITKLFFTDGNYIDDQVKWGTVPIWDSIKSVAGHIIYALTLHDARFASFFPLGIIGAIFILIGVAKSFKNRGIKTIQILCIIGLCASPFLMTIYMGAIPTARAQFALQFVSAFLCVIAYVYIKKWNHKASLVGIASIVVVTWIMAQMIFRLQYTDDIRYEEDSFVGRDIASEIYRVVDEKNMDKPVVFFGARPDHLNAACKKIDMFGMSYFEAGYSEDNQTGATIRICRFMKTLGYDFKDGYVDYSWAAFQVVDDMDAYPHAGFVKELDDCIVVKLSDK